MEIRADGIGTVASATAEVRGDAKPDDGQKERRGLGHCPGQRDFCPSAMRGTHGAERQHVRGHSEINVPLVGLHDPQVEHERIVAQGRGDLAASLDIEALYVAEHEPLRWWFWRHLGPDQELAEDLASEVFVRAWAKRGTYRARPGVPARAWLYRIARNLLTDHWRARRPTRRLDDLIEPSYTLRLGEVGERDELAAVVDTLPDNQRAVIIGRFYERRPAAALTYISISVDGVRQLQKRALVTLRKALGAA